MYDSFRKILAVFVNYNSLLQMSLSIQVEKNTCSYLQFKSVQVSGHSKVAIPLWTRKTGANVTRLKNATVTRHSIFNDRRNWK